MDNLQVKIQERLDYYTNQVKAQKEAFEAIIKEIHREVAAGKKPAEKAASAMLLQHTMMKNEGAIQALSELLNR